MPRPVACANCRQDKLRCDASTFAPDPCTRCRKRKLECNIDTAFKRTPARKRLQCLTQEVRELRKSLNNTDPSPSCDTTSVANDRLNPNNEALEIGPSQDGFAQLGEVLLQESDVLALFQEYLVRFHPLLPILDPAIDILGLRTECPPLFWSILTTAARGLKPSLYMEMCKFVPSLISGSFFFNNYSVKPCQALLILCMWPLPIDQSNEDVRWIYSGIAMQMSMMAGLHRIGSNHEYRKAGASRLTERDERELSRTWYCCCYVNAILSSEFGLPAALDYESVRIRESFEDVLPWSFLCSVKVSLESARINRVLDQSFSNQTSTDDTAMRLGMLRMLEIDLDSLVSSMRARGGKLDAAFDLSVLVAKLNLYSSGLNQATKFTLPEAIQLRMATFTCATQLISLFIGIPLIPESAETTTSVRNVQTLYPRMYWKAFFYACLALLKLGLTSSLPEMQIDQSRRTVQQGYDFILACSTEEMDDLWRAARLIRLLRQEAVQELIRPRHEVHSRMGASIMYELILSAVSWRKQREAELSRELSDLSNNPAQGSRTMDDGLGISEMSQQTLDDWFADSGAAVGFDMNIWNNSMFEEFLTTLTSVEDDNSVPFEL